jgi:hypothetical protein
MFERLFKGFLYSEYAWVLYTAVCGKLITKLSEKALNDLWNMKIKNKWTKIYLRNLLPNILRCS